MGSGFGGCSLIERHLDALTRNGVAEIAATVGYGAEILSKILAGRADTVDNPAYREGSIVSLWVQRVRLRSGRPVLLMDGDVLYDSRMIERLLAADGEAVPLVDRELETGDEQCPCTTSAVAVCCSSASLRPACSHRACAAIQRWRAEDPR
jgi:choline kinase